MPHAWHHAPPAAGLRGFLPSAVMRRLLLACAMCLAVVGAAAAVRPDGGAPGRGRPSIAHGGRSHAEAANAHGTVHVGPRDAEGTAAGHVVLRDDGSLAFARGSPDVVSAGGPPPEVVAEGNFTASSEHASGFGELRLRTLPGRDDRLQARAAGFLEGWLTAEAIFDHQYNIQYYFDGLGNGTKAIMSWLGSADKWTTEQVAAHNAAAAAAAATGDARDSAKGKGKHDHSRWWRAVGLVLEQLNGIMEGYNARVDDMDTRSGLTKLERKQLLLLNGLGELMDLIPMFITGQSPELLPGLPADVAWRRLATSGHCSALIRLTGDLSDLMIGHVTWNTYYSMVRVYKHYDFTAMTDPALVGKRVSMSSYPAAVSSIDDFYIVGSSEGSMVVMETTNDVLDAKLHELITSQAALSQYRVMAANMLASSGQEWVDLVQLYHSGAYNNQYMVVDLKRFKPGEELRVGLLTVMEIMPGYAESADVTRQLEVGFWASYNVPYFNEVYSRMGYPAMRAAFEGRGKQYDKVVRGLSYQLAPRAKIFRRDAGSVSDVTDLMRVLRYNAATNDSYSGGDVWGTICARGDLVPGAAVADGCIDGKVTTFAMAQGMAALAVNGPSSDGGTPAFDWSEFEELSVVGPHKGMPDVYSTRWSLHAP